MKRCFEKTVTEGRIIGLSTPMLLLKSKILRMDSAKGLPLDYIPYVCFVFDKRDVFGQTKVKKS
jgi:hypothetical protein